MPNISEATTRLYELIKARNLQVYSDDAMRLAVSRAVAVEGSRGWKISKEKQSHKVDFVVALGMAVLAATEVPKSTCDGSLRWVTESYNSKPKRTETQSPTVAAIATMNMMLVR
jgi:phage terminase large subunit-like protein